MNKELLQDALAEVAADGFGENVDADSIIEEAAKYLLGDLTGAVAVLNQFLDTLPSDHHERAGVIRAIEVLQHG